MLVRTTADFRYCGIFVSVNRVTPELWWGVMGRLRPAGFTNASLSTLSRPATCLTAGSRLLNLLVRP
uniref:Repressor protein C4 n=1 Tax=Escherichia phage P1 TaxID=2886926 RepID=RPC4_BPP1|nr:RecName: Full=Repressor protein C4 [Escherichia phage P1]AAA32417.1 c4 repressor [Escherichia phage P1]CAA33658.1 c4 [Escherichia phage P1]